MADRESILVDNLTEALKRSERYLVIGLIASASLAILALLPGDIAAGVTVPVPGFPQLPRSAATAVLLAVIIGAPFMASFTLSRVLRIADELSSNRPLLDAALTFPCIATTRVHGPRLVVAFGPPVFVFVSLLAEGGGVTSPGITGFVIFIAVPYGSLWWFYLRTAVGGAVPDAHGD
jgi:hypothetical protein